MKNRFLKKKVLILVIVYILSLLFSLHSTFASDNDSSLFVTLPSIDNIVNNNDNWFIVLSPNTNRYNIYIYDGNVTFTGKYHIDGCNQNNPDELLSWSFKEDKYHFYFSSGSTYSRYTLENDTWVLFDSFPTSYSCLQFSYDSSNHIVASNFDLKNNFQIFENSNVVFQKATTLSTLRGIHLNQKTWEAVRLFLVVMVAGIGLLIFSTGLKKGFQQLVNGFKN